MNDASRIVERLNAGHVTRGWLNNNLIMARGKPFGGDDNNAYSFMGVMPDQGEIYDHDPEKRYDVVFLKDLGSDISSGNFAVEEAHLMSAEELINETGFPFDEYYSQETGETLDLSSPAVFRGMTYHQVAFLQEFNRQIAERRFAKKKYADFNKAAMDDLSKREKPPTINRSSKPRDLKNTG